MEVTSKQHHGEVPLTLQGRGMEELLGHFVQLGFLQSLYKAPASTPHQNVPHMLWGLLVTSLKVHVASICWVSTCLQAQVSWQVKTVRPG